MFKSENVTKCQGAQQRQRPAHITATFATGQHTRCTEVMHHAVFFGPIHKGAQFLSTFLPPKYSAGGTFSNRMLSTSSAEMAYLCSGLGT